MLRRVVPSSGLARTATTAAAAATTQLSLAVRYNSIINEVRIDPSAPPAKKLHGRSEFKYSGSTKGEEVGARNEAAYIAYEPMQPQLTSEPAAVFAMPHLINLLTIAPVSIALSVIAAAAWGVAMWRFYASQHFTSVVIERP